MCVCLCVCVYVCVYVCVRMCVCVHACVMALTVSSNFVMAPAGLSWGWLASPYWYPGLPKACDVVVENPIFPARCRGCNLEGHFEDCHFEWSPIQNKS